MIKNCLIESGSPCMLNIPGETFHTGQLCKKPNSGKQGIECYDQVGNTSLSCYRGPAFGFLPGSSYPDSGASLFSPLSSKIPR
jgi:hypothetical protein